MTINNILINFKSLRLSLPGAGSRVNTPNSQAVLPIFEALENNSEFYLRKLLEQRQILVNVKPSGETPLCLAAKKAQTSLVSLLLNHPSTNPNIPDELEGNTPLHIAAQNGDVATLKELLSHPYIAVDMKNNEEKTPLELALEALPRETKETKAQLQKCIAALLEHNAALPLPLLAELVTDPNTPPEDVALIFKHPDSRSILQNLQDSHLFDENASDNLLYFATRNNDYELASKLVGWFEMSLLAPNHRGNVPIKAIYQDYPKDLDRYLQLFQLDSQSKDSFLYVMAVNPDTERLLTDLKSRKIPLKHFSKDCSPAEIALLLGNKDCAQLLIDHMHPAQIDILFVRLAQMGQLEHLSYFAAKEKRISSPESTIYFIQELTRTIPIYKNLCKNVLKLIDINCVYKNSTPLTAAIESKNQLWIQILLDAGADPLQQTQRGMFPAYSALFYDSTGEVFKKHFSHLPLDTQDSQSFSLLAIALSKGLFSIADECLQAGLNVNFTDDLGISPLYYAIASKQTALANTLLDKGANPNISTQSPLLAAVRLGDAALINRLLAIKDIHINCLNEKGCSALYYAVKAKNYDLVSTLLAKGANPNLCGQDAGKLPLVAAIKGKDRKMFDLLLNSGASIDIHENAPFVGQTPLLAAVESALATDDVYFFNTLLERGANPHFSNAHGMTPRIFYDAGLKKETPIYALIDKALKSQDDYLQAFLVKVYTDNVIASGKDSSTDAEFSKPFDYSWGEEGYSLNSTFFWSHHYVNDIVSGWSGFCEKNDCYVESSKRTCQALLRTYDSKEQMKAFSETGEPILCLCRWNRHAISVGIYRDPTSPDISYLVIVNGGYRPTDPPIPPIHVLAISTNAVNVDLLEELKNHTYFTKRKQAADYFYIQLPAKLSASTNITTKTMEQQFACTEQSVGNCTYYCVQKLTYITTLYLETDGRFSKTETKKMKNTFRTWHISFKANTLKVFENFARKENNYQLSYFQDGQTRLKLYRPKIDNTLAYQMKLSDFLASVDQSIETIAVEEQPRRRVAAPRYFMS